MYTMYIVGCNFKQCWQGGMIGSQEAWVYNLQGNVVTYRTRELRALYHRLYPLALHVS